MISISEFKSDSMRSTTFDIDGQHAITVYQYRNPNIERYWSPTVLLSPISIYSMSYLIDYAESLRQATALFKHWKKEELDQNR